MRKYLTLNLKKPLSDLYHGELVEPKSLNKNEQPPIAKPTRHAEFSILIYTAREIVQNMQISGLKL